MPYTFRKPLHLQKESSLDQTIEYIKNAEKTLVVALEDDNDTPEYSLESVINYALNRNKTYNNSHLYVSGHNCSPTTAETEMRKNLEKYDAWKEGSRIAYHTVISFSQESGITNEELMKFGEEFCRRYYGDYQCVIAGHVNETKQGRGKQPHLHIVSCAMDLHGNRLLDDMFNSPTSLARLREVSDKLSIEMGFPIIECDGLYGQKLDYVKSLLPTQSNTLQGLIDKYKPVSTDIGSLIENIQLETGAEIKVNHKSKSISAKLPGNLKFKRFKSLGSGYSYAELEEYFRKRLRNEIPEDLLNSFIKAVEGDEELLEKVSLQVESIKQPQYRIEKGIRYERLEYARLKTLSELERLQAYEKYLDEHQIYSKKDFMALIAETNTKLVRVQNSYDTKLKELREDLNEFNQIRSYLATLSAYKQGQPQGEAELHERLREKFGDDIQAIRERHKELREECSDLQKELLQLTQLKEQAKLNKELLDFGRSYTGETEIPSFSFSKNQIISQENGRTTVQVPYLKGKCISINTSQISLNKYGRFEYFLIPDEKITIRNVDQTKPLSFVTATTNNEISITVPENYVLDQGIQIPFTDMVIQVDSPEQVLNIPLDDIFYSCINAKTGNEYSITGKEIGRQVLLANSLAQTNEKEVSADELLKIIEGAKKTMQNIKRQDNQCKWALIEEENRLELYVDEEMIDRELSDEQVTRVRLPFSTFEVDIPTSYVNGNTISLSTTGEDYLTVTSKNKLWKQREDRLAETAIKNIQSNIPQVNKEPEQIEEMV